MSDAMTNSEIEDVLTSIRRLVSQEGDRGAETSKLVLTAEHRVMSPETDAAATVGPAEVAPAPDQPASAEAEAPQTPNARQMPAPDFTQLEATIAELEAAVAQSSDEFEGEAVESAPKASNVTELYGRLNFKTGEASQEDAAPVEVPVEATVSPEPEQSAEATVHPDLIEAEIAAAEQVDAEADTPIASVDAAQDDVDFESGFSGYELPPIEASPDTDAELIDEEVLRDLVGQIVREELHGQLGERITMQVRKLVRAEIAKALDDRKFL